MSLPVMDILRVLGITEENLDKLEEQEISSRDDILLLSKADLKEMEISIGQRNRILKWVKCNQHLYTYKRSDYNSD